MPRVLHVVFCKHIPAPSLSNCLQSRVSRRNPLFCFNMEWLAGIFSLIHKINSFLDSHRHRVYDDEELAVNFDFRGDNKQTSTNERKGNNINYEKFPTPKEGEKRSFMQRILVPKSFSGKARKNYRFRSLILARPLRSFLSPQTHFSVSSQLPFQDTRILIGEEFLKQCVTLLLSIFPLSSHSLFFSF
jgi:hypothetical protein